MADTRTGQPETAAPQQAPGRRRPSRWKVAFVTLLVMGVLATAAWVLLGSRLLVVRYVEVSGNHLVPRDRLIAVARVRLGLPMARLDTDAVRDRVEGVQEIESASVERHWPATVRIVVHERVPVVAAERGGVYYRLDRNGMTVIGDRVRPKDVPLLMVAAPGPGDPATLASLRVVRELPARFGSRLASVEASSPEAVTLHFRSGLTVVWGAAERSADKVRLIDALQRTPAGRGARSIDVSSPEVVTTR